MTTETPLVRPPRLRAGESEERRATWFEVFFDPVFVVVIAQLTSGRAADPTVTGIVRFAGLFIPLWWAWVLFTYYCDRFDTDDLAHRLLMLASMLAGRRRLRQPPRRRACPRRRVRGCLPGRAGHAGGVLRPRPGTSR